MEYIIYLACILYLVAHSCYARKEITNAKIIIKMQRETITNQRTTIDELKRNLEKEMKGE